MILTKTQVELLKLCIEADRRYRSLDKAGEFCHYDNRGVEISPITGFQERTARALEDAGLVELVNIHRHTRAFLGKYRAYDDV